MVCINIHNCVMCNNVNNKKNNDNKKNNFKVIILCCVTGRSVRLQACVSNITVRG